ncbi:hypothetical protein KGF54_003155 [Candida jiufengensis]|uniref:uncharacterized protein n=1 Tax=Candida jiufengensis TaxID=497108 RepID=UPI002224DE1A|nr:uncharacterized protein KGF54_003155 [Candida jiufengensis]KAI5952289.1 hypothetical protein KGF54_003155 [Candida jiufengensis]
MTSIITAKIHELMTETGNLVDQISNKSSHSSIKPLNGDNSSVNVSNEKETPLMNSGGKFSSVNLSESSENGKIEENNGKSSESTEEAIASSKNATSSIEKAVFQTANNVIDVAIPSSKHSVSAQQSEAKSTDQSEAKSADQVEVKLVEQLEVKSEEIIKSPSSISFQEIKSSRSFSPPPTFSPPPYKSFSTIKPSTKRMSTLVAGDLPETSIENDISRSKTIMNVVENKFNPISKTLNMKPTIRKFKLINSGHLTCYSPLLVNTTTQDENKTPQVNYWISSDYDQFFGINNFQREIELTKSLRNDEDSLINLNDEKIIYISTKILNPDKIFNIFFKNSINKRDLYIDLILNNNGCNILLQIMRYFKENEIKLNSKINSVYIKFSASYVNQIKVIFNLLTENAQFYQKIKSLGLFMGLHHYGNGYVFGLTDNTMKIRLPPSLEKLIVANGLSLNDFAHLPITMKEIGLHNVSDINFSRFNLNKNLSSLSINGDIRLFGRIDNYPKGFLELKSLKFDSSVVVCHNFFRFNNLTSLSLSNLSFARTRELSFPLSLRKLELIDCLISSHMTAFPDALRLLIIIDGKWRCKKICNMSRLQRLKVENCDVSDLDDKIISCLNLLKLEVINCSINVDNKFKFPLTLKILKLVNVSLQGINKSAFPPFLEIVNLESNDLEFLLPKLNLKILRMDSNNLDEVIDAAELPLKDIILSNNPRIQDIQLHNQTTYLNASKTNIKTILGDGLSKLILNECKNVNWKEFKFPRQITQLSLKKCELTEFEIFEKLLKLKILDLSNNKLNKFNLNNFENLQDIDLSFNNLEELRSEDFAYGSVKSINCESNCIKEVELDKLKNLDWLQLSNNKLSTLADLELPDSVRNLNLSNNEIEEIDQDYRIFKNLQFLNLSKCKISKFNTLISNNLISLNLSRNHLGYKNFIIEFEKIGKSNLKFLDLSNNYFTTFKFDIFNHKTNGIELNEINLANNMFEELPTKIPDNILSAILFKT